MFLRILFKLDVFYSLVPESIRWLRVNGKTNEAEDVLKCIAKRNKKDWPVNVNLAPTVSENNKSLSVKYLFYPFQMAVSTLIQMFAW